MKKQILAAFITSSVIFLTACGGNDDAKVTYVTDAEKVPLNNIQNPVVAVKSYLKNDDVLSNVSAERSVIDYKMLGVDGTETIATTLLFTPNTLPPKSGWPIVVWAHGTTGVADICAPSQRGLQGTEYFIAQLLAAGYVVVAPDYEGLGSQGSHPFLNVKSEAFSITDAVVAARDYLNKQGKTTSKQWLSIGHSQGGQAVLGAAEYASRAQLDYKGTIAIAPASNLEAVLTNGEKAVANTPTDIQITTYEGLDTFTSLIVAGLQGHKNTVSYMQAFKPNLAAVATKAETECYESFRNSIGSSMKNYADSNNNSLSGYGRLQDNFLNISVVKTFLEKESQPLQEKVSTPIIIYQGSVDTIVPKSATDGLVASSTLKGIQINYKTDKDELVPWTHTTVYTSNFANFMQDVKTLMPIQ